jgi:outer membrane protein TolC
MRDHMLDGRGFPIEPYAWFIDPFGNSRRCYPSVESGVEQLNRVATMDRAELSAITDRATDYISQRSWPKVVDMLEEELHTLKSARDLSTKRQDDEIRRIASKVAIY